MIELGLQRISRLLAHTPLPWRAIHVAGTNGKGSICAYTSRMIDVFNESDWRKRHNLPAAAHGRFTSPHLIDRWDCITLDQQPVASQLFHAIEEEVVARTNNSTPASEFELLTATAFEIFTREAINIGVVEVGMGGRLDATNILGQKDIEPPLSTSLHAFRPLPLVSVIAKIGLDHQAFLGDSIQEIATEKAGIIKNGVPVLLDESNEDSVRSIIYEIAAQRGSPVIMSDSKSAKALISDNHAATTMSEDGILPAADIRCKLGSLPDHAFINASLALTATLIALEPFCNMPLMAKPPPDLAAAMLSAAINMPLPGRQQQLPISSLIRDRKSPILLDGAHNAQSAEALSQVLSRSKPTEASDGTKFVIAASSTKPASDILQPLLGPDDEVFVVEFGPVDGMPWVRPLPCEELAASARAVMMEKTKAPHGEAGQPKVKVYGNDILGALRAACGVAREGPVVVVGSLYLVGDVLRLLREA